MLCSAARTPIFVSSSTSLLRWSFWWSLSLVRDKRTLFTRRLTGPWSGARLPTKIFRCQVFFDNDPSSAASLRSATRKWVKDGWLWGFLDQEDPEVTNQPRPSVKVKRWRHMRSVVRWAREWSSPRWPPGDWGPVLELTQPPRLLSSATRSSVSTILLLLPVFFLQPASRPDPERQPATDTTVMVYSGGIQSGQQMCPLWERVDWGCDTPSGWCGGTGGTPSHS